MTEWKSTGDKLQYNGTRSPHVQRDDRWRFFRRALVTTVRLICSHHF
ncbi:hypothetical protein RTCIAT899_PB00355 (plasmid) [Rhizobium tropici CIAT 899]|nr:hypothetical protein RTCIAT899_PB00355 [Rhizobium tropici CIAT 899]